MLLRSLPLTLLVLSAACSSSSEPADVAISRAGSAGQGAQGGAGQAGSGGSGAGSAQAGAGQAGAGQAGAGQPGAGQSGSGGSSAQAGAGQSGGGQGGAQSGAGGAQSGAGGAQSGAGGAQAGGGGAAQGGAGNGAGGGQGGCPDGMVCVSSFPFSHEADTSSSGASVWDSYGCAPDKNEGGHERVYRVEVPKAGFLSAAVYDDASVDVDVHLLSALDPASCLARGDKHARADVEAGVYYVVVDSFVSGGQPQEGAYRVDIGFVEPSSGPCGMESGEMPRVNDGGDTLQMPATGPIVVEAHLVTQAEPEPFPATSTDELAEHYALSQAATGLVMFRSQVWAPEEGGKFYGAGIGSPADFPVMHEGWYVNMYWTAAARPPKGTPMILRKPGTNRAVVVAAGYETGPGNLAHIGGTPEETHFYLGTGHLDVLTLGIASDASLPIGPRVCTD